ncbi:DNA helicase B isoform X3 [Denticeps clupeoides]|uniref:DNA helicase B isoform X3 n=1 Tax=Denticeps clupeoides TaxID=299321 RepID=UPI0010A4F605|nr:DNA helicase B isoform X3 [Denticeps clupeoides]
MLAASLRSDAVLTGYILPTKEHLPKSKDSDDEDEEEEEEEQPEFLDIGEMESMSSGGHVFQSARAPYRAVLFQDLTSGSECCVEGRFVLTDPWWEVTCKVKRLRSGTFVLQGSPAYKLRDNLGSDGRSLVSLFLARCTVPPPFVQQLMDWLPEEREISPCSLPDILEEFGLLKEHKAVATQIKCCVFESSAGVSVQAAVRYPLVMKYLPTLLPRQFTQLLGKGKWQKLQKGLCVTVQGCKPTETSTQPFSLWASPAPSAASTSLTEQEDCGLLASLEEVIRSDAWMLGFNCILYRRLKLIRCEAKVEALRDCGLFNKFSTLHCSALLVYDSLKQKCHRTGGTYVELAVLVQGLEKQLDELSVREAIKFLQEQRVVLREQEKLALWNFHHYETGIADCLQTLVQQDAWHIQLDVSKVLRDAQIKRLIARTSREGSLTYVGQVNDTSGACRHNTVSPVETGMPSRNAQGHIEEPDTSSTIQEFTQSNVVSNPENQPEGVELDPDQVRAAEMICANPVTVISGKGGCGKTMVVSEVFRAAVYQQIQERQEVLHACRDFQNSDDHLQPDPSGKSQVDLLEPFWVENGEKGDKMYVKEEDVLLTAPTGRAARLLAKRTKFMAYTMHQVLFSFMNIKKESADALERWKFRKVRVLVVDEGSLVCVQILHSLLSILTEYAQLRKFILLGDVRQLPSIEPGNTLDDLFRSLRQVRWAIEMRTNHRAESERIVKNAGLISEMGQMRRFSDLDFDAVVDFSRSSQMPEESKSFIFVRLKDNSSIDLQQTILELLKAAPGLKDDKCSQFVAFRRRHCELINHLCCKHYSGHLTSDHKKRLLFCVQDKVCCTRNGYLSERPVFQTTPLDKGQSILSELKEQNHDNAAKRDENPAKDPKERLCNGEIFFIKEDKTEVDERGKKRRYLTLDDQDGRELCLDYRELQRECRLRHAWARTIHTYQGSEAETIVYVLGDGTAQDWRHVYTAVTRGQKRVYVIATDTAMKRAITWSVKKRQTKLAGLVKKCVSSNGDLLIQPSSSQHLHTPSRPVHGVSVHQSPCQSTTKSQSHVRALWRDQHQESSSTKLSLQDDIAFSQTYGWSPMEESHEDTGEHCGIAQDHNVWEEPVFTQTGSPVSKRHDISDVFGTPRKQRRVSVVESPLGCSCLRKLNLNTPEPSPSPKALTVPNPHLQG